MKKLFLAATALSTFLVFSGAASAADVVMEEPAYDWTGFYLGVFGGYAFGDSDVDGDFDSGGETYDLDPDGFVAGATAGYNWQSDQLVLGLEGEVGYNDADDDITPADDFAEVDYGIYGTLALRLGWAFDNVLFYGKAGGALAEIDNEAGDLDGGNIDDTDFASDDQTAFGYVLGAGIEWGFSEALSLKAEYNYMEFEDGDDNNDDGDDYDFENDTHVVKVGLNFAL